VVIIANIYVNAFHAVHWAASPLSVLSHLIFTVSIRKVNSVSKIRNLKLREVN